MVKPTQSVFICQVVYSLAIVA